MVKISTKDLYGVSNYYRFSVDLFKFFDNELKYFFQGYCELPSGLTILGEDTVVDVQKCDSLHCFEHNMTYAAPDSQMVALIESSERCSQSIKMECLSAPYQVSNLIIY